MNHELDFESMKLSVNHEKSDKDSTRYEIRGKYKDGTNFAIGFSIRQKDKNFDRTVKLELTEDKIK